MTQTVGYEPMRTGFADWVHDVRNVMADSPKQGLLLGAYYTYVGANLTVTSRWADGTSIYDREWDALIVLDACRVDALRAIADEFDFVEDVNSIRSVGSTSGEWMVQTFDRRNEAAIEQTAMVTANVHSGVVLWDRLFPPQYVAAPVTWPAWNPVDPESFALLDEVWDDQWDAVAGTVAPRSVTDRAIAAGRAGGFDRLIVHYLQPHAPYIEVDEAGEVSTVYREPLKSLQRGELSAETAWEAYLDTLRVVLEEIGLLLDNLDAERVILTADHGEAFGELGFYEHPVCCPHPVVRRVPWVETTACDRDRHQPPQRVRTDEQTDERTTVGEQLEALGYVS